MVRKLILFPICFLLQFLMISPASAQGILSSDREAENRLSSYTGYTAPRKVYLHLNKSSYNAGDAIWFKAYHLDGITHAPDTATTNLYVDLVSSRGLIMERRILLLKDGFAEGDISLPGSIPDGNYKIRAYTDWMKNFGEDFYFTRYFYIHNQSYANIIPRAEVRSNRRFNNNLESMAAAGSIAFFPEGGSMVEGVKGRVAFKAFDGMGRGIDAEGQILNERSEPVATFKTGHAGTGSFELAPSSGSAYTARVSFNGSRPVDVSLPQALSEGTGIKVEQDEDNILIDIKSSYSPGNPHFNTGIRVIAHARGKVVHSESLSLQDGTGRISVPRSLFPSGIAHITVFSGNFTPLAERLVFVHHNEAFVFYPGVNKQTAGNREYYVVDIDVADRNGQPVEGSFSLSVLHTGSGIPEMKDNIIANLLISSDLPGIVENINELLDPEQDMSVAVDNLIMTHGWRRFAWEDVLAGKLPEIRYQPSSSLTISGRAFDPARKQILPNFPVDLTIRGEENLEYSTNTNTEGNFLFDGLKFFNNVNIRISSDRLVSNHPPSLELNSGEIQGIDYVANVHTLPNRITSRGDNWERTAGAGISPYSLYNNDGATSQQYGVPDQTVFIEKDTKQPNMYDILITRVRGLNHNLQFRGPTSLYLSSTPLFMLDGSEVGQAGFLNLDPRYIERIEIFSSSRASIFGVRGANGAILAYTRRAGDPGMAAFEEFLIEGYHSPREYYSDFVSAFTGEKQVRGNERSVHWEPYLNTDGSGRVTTTVPVVSSPGTLTFIIEGTGIESGVGFGVFSIRMAP